jgi:hypothetical protein
MEKEKGAMMRSEESVTSLAEAAIHESRREALKKFARYAAVAPTAMVLLEPRVGRAHHKPGHTRGGGGGSDY